MENINRIHDPLPFWASAILPNLGLTIGVVGAVLISARKTKIITDQWAMPPRAVIFVVLNTAP